LSAEVIHGREKPRPRCRRMKVAGLVLAAGDGSRFGRPKAGVILGGRALMDLAIESCVRAGLDPVVVVLGAWWPTSMPAAGRQDGDRADIRLVDNPDWVTGMASSVRAGLAALQDDPDVDAAVLTLVDTPSVGDAHLRRIASALQEGAAAAAATYDGTMRTPAGLTREVWAGVARSVAGDQGARTWLRSHPDLVTAVECADLGSWTDIDTPGDLPD
jgi:CTP:molybdopterin cytidylyltransferase MocA